MLTISARFFASKVATSRAAVATTTTKFPTGMKISPYAMYIKENYKNDPNVKNTDLMKDLSVKWKEMSISEKTKYSDLSKNHNEKKMSDFLKLSADEQSTMVRDAQEKKADRASRRQAKERREKRKQEGRPTPPPSAYALFIKEKLSGAGSDVKENMKNAVAQWKTLSDAQKQKYTEQAKKLMDEYHAIITKLDAEKKDNSSQ